MAEHDGVRLQIRHVQIAVSEDTAALWDAMTRRCGFQTFDETVQALAMAGAAALAQVDLGVIPERHLPGDPDALRSIVWPWLRRMTDGRSGVGGRRSEREEESGEREHPELSGPHSMAEGDGLR